MRIALLTLAIFFAIFSPVIAAEPPADAQSSRGGRIIGYFADWTKYNADQIPAEKLTHINYAFAVIIDGKCAMKNPAAAESKFEGLRQLKQKHPHLKTLISIGGWTDSTGFYDVAKTPESREIFAKSAAAFAKKNGFDGVDIDWEYPGGGGNDKGKGGPEDTKNFTALLTDLRRALDDQGKTDGKHYLLTIAAPAGGQAKRIELDKIHPLLDFINLMTYDFAGEWSGTTGFNAPLFPSKNAPADAKSMSGDTAVKTYLEAGVPADKLVLGVPFYGRAWGGVKKVDNGLFQPATKKPPRPEGGGFGYRNLADHYINKVGKRFRDEGAKVPWLYDEKSGLFISYDDPESLRLKGAYVREHKLGGVMIWELSDDDAQSSLLNALSTGLNSSASPPRAGE